MNILQKFQKFKEISSLFLMMSYILDENAILIRFLTIFICLESNFYNNLF